MVVFLDNPEKYNSAAMYKQIEDEVRLFYKILLFFLLIFSFNFIFY